MNHANKQQRDSARQEIASAEALMSLKEAEIAYVSDIDQERLAQQVKLSGAKGVVLWGHEPHIKAGTEQPYAQLPHFVRSLKRVAALEQRVAADPV